MQIFLIQNHKPLAVLREDGVGQNVKLLLAEGWGSNDPDRPVVCVVSCTLVGCSADTGECGDTGYNSRHIEKENHIPVDSQTVSAMGGYDNYDCVFDNHMVNDGSDILHACTDGCDTRSFLVERLMMKYRCTKCLEWFIEPDIREDYVGCGVIEVDICPVCKSDVIVSTCIMENVMEIKDSGTRRGFESGAVRDAETGKGRFDLLSWFTLRRLAIHMEKGADKYAARNWEKGMPLSVFFDSAIRHAYKYLAGEQDEDHAAAALWNFHGLIHIEEMIARGVLPQSLNDLPQYEVPQIDGMEECCKAISNIFDPPKKMTAYFSHHIRGKKGNDATQEEMNANRDDAIRVCNKVRELLPNWTIYCPAEVDEVVNELFLSKTIGEKEILAADCKILERRDALLAYCKDNHVSGGMEVEIDHANTMRIPYLEFSGIDHRSFKETLQKFAKDVETYG